MPAAPKVSVSIISYNQADYIESCLESVLSQRTTFPFEVIVGDDGSVDGTQARIKRLQEERPHIVRPIFHDVNVGPTANHNDVVAACRGEFIAHVDGDDRMLPGKLAKQVAFLEAHGECAMVVHKVNVIGADGART